MGKNSVSCLLCKSELAVNNLLVHYNSKKCKYGGKLKNCPYCDKDIFLNSDAGNHIRWCKENPTRGNGILDNPNRGKQFQTKESRAKNAISISNAHKDGSYLGAPDKAYKTRVAKSIDGIVRMSSIGKINCQTAALKSKHQRVSKRTHKFTDKHGRTFMFDSSWEDALAIRLDKLNINWTRPKPIQYELTGKKHNYFPDFYLPEYNIYLDPKNPYVIYKQKDKLEIVAKLINLIIIPSKNKCENFNITHLQHFDHLLELNDLIQQFVAQYKRL
jgi:hypothetical protein